MTTELVRRETVEELCAKRLEALDMYQQGLELLKKAELMHAKAAPGVQTHGCPNQIFVTYTESQDWREKMRKEVDRDLWRHLMKASQIWSLMDATERKKFDRELDDNPPPATPDTIAATLARLVGDAGAMFNRGLVKAFQELSRDYRSNDGFKIGKRVVMEFVFSPVFDSFSSRAEEELRDVDRVMHVLDGKPAPEYQEGLTAAMRMAFRVRPRVREVTTPYWRCKWFKNGNAHLYPLRQDLIDKANRIIAEHFGMTLPDAPGHGTNQKRPKPKHASDLGDFPSPLAVVDRLMIKAQPMHPGMVALEPSAGAGNIARRLALSCAGVDAIEIQEEHVETLRALKDLRNVHAGDFLDFEPDHVSGPFDRIVMNPPFANGADAEHVLHALDFLAPGGRLVAVMSAGAKFSTRAAYRFLWKRLASPEFGHSLEDLPDGSFKESGTNVRAVILTVDRLRRS